MPEAWSSVRTGGKRPRIDWKEASTMQLPLQIAFHNMSRSDVIEDMVRDRVARLENLSDHLMGCRVVIETPHRHHEHGNQYLVRIDLTVPGGEIVVNREPPLHTANKNLEVALRDAFDSARRQLEDYVRRR